MLSIGGHSVTASDGPDVLPTINSPPKSRFQPALFSTIAETLGECRVEMWEREKEFQKHPYNQQPEL